MILEDAGILALYFARAEQAISETERKYGRYCGAIAHNILSAREDEEECLNDTWLRAWNAIPPQKPRCLQAFLGRITRNLALSRWKAQRTEKRGGGQLALVLEELEECVSGREQAEESWQRHELLAALEQFLRALSPQKRRLFLCRYWYADSIKTLSERFGMSESNVSVTLSRLRGALRRMLEERGIGL